MTQSDPQGSLQVVWFKRDIRIVINRLLASRKAGMLMTDQRPRAKARPADMTQLALDF